MLTLVKTKDAVPIVGIYEGKKNRKPVETVYFTHEFEKGNQNVANASGVLHLHKSELKKEFRSKHSAEEIRLAGNPNVHRQQRQR